MLTVPALVLLVVLVGCNKEEIEGAGDSSKSAEPSITILSPLPNEVWTEDTVKVKVEVKNFIMDPLAIGKARVPGRGHWHLYLDGDWVGASADQVYELDRVSPGPHHLKAALANNDHSLLNPSVEHSVVIDHQSGEEHASSPDVEAAESKFPEIDPSPHFVSSYPTHGEELYRSPELVKVSFDFNLAPESAVEITRDGEPVAVGPLSFSADKMSMSASVEDKGDPGIYQVSYRACWPYLNCHKGSFAFLVESHESDNSKESN